MEAQLYENNDTKQTHRIEMLMLAILVPLHSISTCLPGRASLSPITISSSSCSLISTLSAERTIFPSP